METLLIDPIALSIGSLKIHWYGIIISCAALCGMYLAIWEGKRFGIPSEFFMDLLLFGVPSAVIAARIYYVAFKWDDYKGDLWQVFAVWNGGIAIYGALIGALICGYVLSRKKGYSFWKIADICAPGLLVGQMIGRWGNFMNQEAYGGPVSQKFLSETLSLPDWIVNQMNVSGIFHHPTFLYESLWNLVGLALLFVLRRQTFLKAGELLMSYFVWYSLGRFYIEGLRTDSLAFNGPDWLASLMNGLWKPMKMVFEAGYLDPAYGDVRISQFVSIVTIVVAIVFIIVRRVRLKNLPRYLD